MDKNKFIRSISLQYIAQLQRICDRCGEIFTNKRKIMYIIAVPVLGHLDGIFPCACRRRELLVTWHRQSGTTTLEDNVSLIKFSEAEIN